MQPLFLDPMKFPTADAHVAEIIEAAVITHSMAVFTLADDELRTELMQQHATSRGGVYLSCERWKTNKQFLLALASQLDVQLARTAYELFQSIKDALDTNSRPLFFNQAELLKPDMFNYIQSLHDKIGVLIVMAGAPDKLLSMADDEDRDHTFWTRCVLRDIDERMQTARQELGEENKGTGVIGRIGQDQEV